MKGKALLKCQILAMLLKKTLFIKKNWILFALQNVTPILLITITVLTRRAFMVAKSIPALKFDFNNYINRPIIIFANHAQNNPGNQFAHNYKLVFEKFNSLNKLYFFEIPDVTSYIMNIKHSELLVFNYRALVGVTVFDDNITVWFNNQLYHTIPLAINMVYNAILSEFCYRCNITVTNDPLPYRLHTKMAMLKTPSNMGFHFASNVGFSMSFVAAYYVIYYIKERATKVKLMQFVSGLNIWVFWITSFIYDVLTFFITILITLLTVFAYQEEGWKTVGDIGRMFILLVCFVYAVLPFVYLFSMIFNIASSGFIKTVMVGIFIGVACFYLVFSLETPELQLKSLASSLTMLFLVSPHFALTQGLNNINTINTAILVSDL